MQSASSQSRQSVTRSCVRGIKEDEICRSVAGFLLVRPASLFAFTPVESGWPGCRLVTACISQHFSIFCVSIESL